MAAAEGRRHTHCLNKTRWTRLVVLQWTGPHSHPPMDELPSAWHGQGLSLWLASCSAENHQSTTGQALLKTPPNQIKQDRQPMDGRVDDDPGDIQAQVLQTTLDVIEISLQDPTEPRDGDGDHDGDCCVICLDSISGPCVALPCGHAHFDFLCLASWLQQQPNCPLCKANVYKVRYADVQKGDEAFYSVPNAAQPRDATGGDDLNRPSRTRFTSQNGLLRETNRRIPRPPPSPNEAIRHRRHIYRHELYSLRKPPPPFLPTTQTQPQTNPPPQT